MARTTPTVWVSWGGRGKRVELEFAQASDVPIVLDTPEWRAWLELPTSRSFAYPIYDEQAGYIRGNMTVRKERRVRGGEYWVAYRRSGGRLHKIYLGREAQLSQERLEQAAERFLVLGRAGLEAKQSTDRSSERKEVMTEE
jgi:hypothetical protein